MTRAARSLLVAGLTVLSSGCALNRRPTLPQPEMAELWSEPADLEQRDLFNGPGGQELAPKSGGRYTMHAVKTTGTQVGYDVKDTDGRAWSAKLGVEARVEVAVSRIVWAIGYHQPASYYVREWTLVGDGQDRAEKPARMRLEASGAEKTGQWAWSKNPFLGTRPMAGLFVMMVMVNNWDLKTAQNPVLRIKRGDTTRTEYMVRDLGASLGKTAWIRLATKDDPDAFEHEPFIDGIANNRVRFHYQGGWLEPHLINSIAPDDVRWVCALLTRLSPAQLGDAFRAGGFTDAESIRYVRRLREKIAEGLSVGKK